MQISKQPGYNPHNGEITSIDRLGEGMSVVYTYYPHDNRSVIEVRSAFNVHGKVEYSKEYDSLIERGGVLKEVQIRQLLCWKKDFFTAVERDCPKEKPTLVKIFSNLEKRLGQLESVRESVRESTKLKAVKIQPKKTRKKRRGRKK